MGPAWVDGNHGERETLRSCYRESLALADDLKCESVAFPLIATGTYGFPKDQALDIALSEIGGFLLTHEMEVTLVVFDRRALELSEELMGGIEHLIDESDARAIHREEYGEYDEAMRRERARRLMNRRAPEQSPPELSLSEPLAPTEWAQGEPRGADLEEMLGQAGKSFQQRLFELIDASGMDDVTVYKKANISRKVFSRIRCKPDYRPKKTTAVAFAVALKLDLPTTRDLLARAELALSPSSRFDLIVTYFINSRNYNIYELNAALFKYGEPTLDD